MKKAAAWLPFSSDGRYISWAGPQKKARGPGRLRADGKIPSRGQFEGTGSVQATLTRASECSLRILRTGLPGSPDQSESADPDESGYCLRLSSAPLFFKALAAGAPQTERRSVNALWGKLPVMAVTKCIVLKEDERPERINTAFCTLFGVAESVFTGISGIICGVKC